MNHDDEHKHGHHHGPHSYWSSWCSPVGLGIFFVTTALAAAIALYTILNLIGAVMTLSNPTPSYSYPAEIQTPTGTTGAGTGAMMTQ
ncbi:MAG: hypothetical protein ABIT47_03395 [Candidatus Paceibacterota bacterium]